MHTRCLYQDCPIPVRPLSSRNARSACSKRSFINLLPSSAEGKNEPCGCCASASCAFGTHEPQLSQATKWDIWQTCNCPHWHNHFNVYTPGLVMCIGSIKFRSRKLKTTPSLHEHTDTQCFDNDMKTWQLQMSPLLVALFEQLPLPVLRLLIKEG